MKRFWTEARAVDGRILLDGKPVRTPRRHMLEAPTSALAEAIAAEWDGVGEQLDPRALPLTGLANAAIDIVAADRAGFATALARYGETDLLAYRANSPAELVSAQAKAWDPLLRWARERYDVHVEVTNGVMHRPQPAATVARLAEAMASRSDFELAALSPIVSIGGSLISGLALAERAFRSEALWNAVNVDELWQEQLWGADDLALASRTARRAEWDAAARFLALSAEQPVTQQPAEREGEHSGSQ